MIESKGAQDTQGFPEVWYEFSDPSHFWFRWRGAVLSRLLDALPRRSGTQTRLLEIGCGTRVLSAQIESMTDWTVDGVDLSPFAIGRAVSGRGLAQVYDISERKPEWRQLFDGLVLFDVLEHIPNTTEFLENAVFHLKDEGFVLINVPARQELYSRYDEVVGHLRRYTIQDLNREMERVGFYPLHIRYWGLLLFPIALLRRWVLRGRADEGEVVRTGFVPRNKWIKWILELLKHTEVSFIRWTPIGTSVMGIYCRRLK